jgi:hypothetical protein
MVYAMLETDASNENTFYHLTTEQEAILEERIEKYEKGAMNFST